MEKWNCGNDVRFSKRILGHGFGKKLICSKCQTLLEIAKNIPETTQSDADCLALIRARVIALSISILQTAVDLDLLAYGDSMRRVRRYFSEINYDQQELSKFEEYSRKRIFARDSFGYSGNYLGIKGRLSFEVATYDAYF